MFSIPDKFHLAFDNWTIAMLLMILMRDFRVDSFTCHQTEYRTGDECCPMCPAGHRVRIDCTEFKSTSCQRCLDGTFMDQPNGLKRCNLCSSCDSGAGLKEKRGCTLTTDTVCDPMEGFYCRDLKSEGCAVAQKHRSCEPGQYISRNGTASTDTECSECSSGSFSDGPMLSCQPHRQCEKENLQLIKAGTSSTDAECGEKSSNTGVVIGVVLVLLVLGGAVIGGVLIWRYLKNKNPNSSTNQQELGKPEEDRLNEPGTNYEDERHQSTSDYTQSFTQSNSWLCAVLVKSDRREAAMHQQHQVL